MSYFEVCLKRGEWLSDEDRLAMYRYLLASNQNEYLNRFNNLQTQGLLTIYVANGEIQYEISRGTLRYFARKIGSPKFSTLGREIPLSKIPRLRISQVQRFFAQSEVDVIWNFPLDGDDSQSHVGGFGLNSFPYYQLEYYSNGRGKLLGLIKKLRINNSELVRKMAS